MKGEGFNIRKIIAGAIGAEIKKKEVAAPAPELVKEPEKRSLSPHEEYTEALVIAQAKTAEREEKEQGLPAIRQAEQKAHLAAERALALLNAHQLSVKSSTKKAELQGLELAKAQTLEGTVNSIKSLEEVAKQIVLDVIKNDFKPRIEKLEAEIEQIDTHRKSLEEFANAERTEVGELAALLDAIKAADTKPNTGGSKPANT